MSENQLVADNVSVQILEGQLENGSCIVVIKVKEGFLASKEEEIAGYPLRDDSFEKKEYAQGLESAIQTSLGLPPNIAWNSWFYECIFPKLSCDVREKNLEACFFANDAEILYLESVFREGDAVCFKARCGLNHLAKKCGTTPEITAMILLRILEGFTEEK